MLSCVCIFFADELRLGRQLLDALPDAPQSLIFAEDVTPDEAAVEAAVDNDLNFYRSPLSVFELCAKVASLLS